MIEDKEIQKSCFDCRYCDSICGEPIAFICNYLESILYLDSPCDKFQKKGKAKVKSSDSVNHPDHYNQGKVECIDAIEAATVGKPGIEAFCVGNVIKYLFRYERKNGLEDVKKSKFYLEKLIEILENKNLDC